MPVRPPLAVLRAAAVSALALACAASTWAGVPAGAAASTSYAVPADGVLKLTGHGYGHGHGMSQYGARGAASKGLSHQQILAFYYPGTVAATAGGNIWVRISADTDGDTRVPVQPTLRLRQVQGQQARDLPTELGGQQVSLWRMRTSGGSTLVEGYTGRWRAFTTLKGAGAFFRSDAKPLTLRLPGGDRAYRGTLRHVSAMTVNVVTLDDLVRGVVAREMPASWAPAAVRAQAVAARTYAAFDRAAHRGRAYHTCDTTSCQVYGGLSSEHPLANAAVTATAGQVRHHGGAPAFTQFSSSNGGWSSAGSRPYLVAKSDPYDGVAGNPHHTWRTTLTRGRVQSAYSSIGTLKRVVVTRRDGNGAWGGRVEEMRLVGSKRTVTVSGTGFRSAMGLKSEWFAFG